jgi:hypothetical protein
MHYKNGREAKNGDKVMLIPSSGDPVVGVLIDATPGNDHCNGRLIPLSFGMGYANLSECLHVDDAKALLGLGEATAAAAQEKLAELEAAKAVEAK